MVTLVFTLLIRERNWSSEAAAARRPLWVVGLLFAAAAVRALFVHAFHAPLLRFCDVMRGPMYVHIYIYMCTITIIYIDICAHVHMWKRH